MTTPHKALLIKARDVLLAACGDRCNSEYNPCECREVASELQAVIDATDAEPVAWIGDSPTKGNGRRLFWSRSEAYRYASNITPLYTRPPVREPLSDAEIDAAWRSVDYQASYDQFRRDVGRAIEASHGIKS